MQLQQSAAPGLQDALRVLWTWSSEGLPDAEVQRLHPGLPALVGQLLSGVLKCLDAPPDEQLLAAARRSGATPDADGMRQLEAGKASAQLAAADAAAAGDSRSPSRRSQAEFFAQRHQQRLQKAAGSIELRVGDWFCGQCGAHNYSRKKECWRCAVPHQSLGSSTVSKADMAQLQAEGKLPPPASSDASSAGEPAAAAATAAGAAAAGAPTRKKDRWRRRAGYEKTEEGWLVARGRQPPELIRTGPKRQRRGNQQQDGQDGPSSERPPSIPGRPVPGRRDVLVDDPALGTYNRAAPGRDGSKQQPADQLADKRAASGDAPASQAAAGKRQQARRPLFDAGAGGELPLGGSDWDQSDPAESYLHRLSQQDGQQTRKRRS